MRFLHTVRMSTVAAGLAALALGAQAQPNAPKQDAPKQEMKAKRPPMERSFGEGPLGRWWNNPKMIEELKLTDEQRKSFDAILQQHRVTLVDLHATLEKAELTLGPLMDEDQPNEGKILAQIDKVAQARAELEKAHARYLLALRSKLTPAQWKQLQAHRPERRMGGPQGPGDKGPGDKHPGMPMQHPGMNGGPSGPIGELQPPPPPSEFDGAPDFDDDRPAPMPGA
jgi:protein CpxP